MKVLGAVVGLLIVGSIAAFLLVPRFRSETKEVSVTPVDAPERRTDTARPPVPEKRVEIPDSVEQKLRDDATRRRLPFFQFLRNNYGKEISSFGVTDAIDTLDLVVTNPDTASIQGLIGQAVSPTAEQYGFRKVRVFIANPPGTLEPLKLAAESAYDGAGRWNTFLK